MNNRIFVGNVSFQCTKEEFTKCFSSMEGFKESFMATKYNSVLSRGYGVVTFDTEENAKKLLDKHIYLFDRELKFSIFVDKENNTKSTYEKSYKFYIAHPKSDTDVNTLKELFNDCGNINVFYTKTDIKGQQYSIIGFTTDVREEVLNKKFTYDGLNLVVLPFKRRTNRYNNNNYNNYNQPRYRSYRGFNNHTHYEKSDNNKQ
jgi:RNA recognition motif-containing protein